MCGAYREMNSEQLEKRLEVGDYRLVQSGRKQLTRDTLRSGLWDKWTQWNSKLLMHL